MILYIYFKNNQTRIVYNDRIEIINKSVLSTIKNILAQYYMTYEGYMRILKKKYKNKYLLPIFINDLIQIIPCASLRNNGLCINFCAIKHYYFVQNKVVIILKNNEIISTDLTKSKWTSIQEIIIQIKKIQG